MVPCRVQMLDGTDSEFDVEKKDIGEALMIKVSEKLNLAETDYFGMTFVQNNTTFWLNLQKEIGKQIKKGPWQLEFQLKFYPNPNLLHEDITRYQVFLQVRRDVLSGKLPCSFIAAALLGSFAVQSELGDYTPDTHGSGFEYVKSMQFTKSQNDELLEKIAELHRTHRACELHITLATARAQVMRAQVREQVRYDSRRQRNLGGQNPSEAESFYLDNAKNLSLYGVHLHDAKASDGDDVMIGVCAVGLLVFKDKLRIHRYTWPKILKIRYKRNNFYIDIRPESSENKAGLDAYKLETVKMAKRLWRIAVDHHAFFRLREPEDSERTKFSRAPYRYSGRTQYQAGRATTLEGRAGQAANRGNAPQFTSSRSTDNLALGYSTERWEKHTVDEYQAATLDLRNPRSGSSLADLDTSHHDAAMEGQVSLLAGGYGAAYARSLNGSQGYPAGADPRYTTFPGAVNNPQYAGSHADAASVVSRQSRQSRQSRPRNGGVGGPGFVIDPYQPVMNDRPPSVADSSYSEASSIQPNGYPQPRPPRRKHISSRSSQSSRNERGPSAANGGYMDEEPGYAMIGDTPSGGWNPQSTNPALKVATRTYTAEDGSIITEASTGFHYATVGHMYRTERNGVIETHIEKRTRVSSVPEEENVDYDRALADAIHAVTDMNPDMSVQKIEIHTRSQEV